MSAIPASIRMRLESPDRILEPSSHRLSPVKEPTFYPSQFGILLRERMRGKTIGQVAEFLGIKPKDVPRLLEGTWRPSKDICRRMGLKTVYALADTWPTAGRTNF